jgi:DNA-directed RNA polymerase subunit RPC12/RpoP
MSKVKMRCARCGKSYKSAGAKQTLCPECDVKARRERVTEKAAGAKATSAPAAAIKAPVIVGPGAGILGVTPTSTAIPAEHIGFGRSAPRSDHDDHERHLHGHTPTPQRDHHDERASSPAAPTKAHASKSEQAEKRAHGNGRPPVERQPRSEKAPRPAQFELTDELRGRIEARYLELAQPVEFDGIRTQIAGELSVPKHIVKQVIRELRAARQLPSWWELKSFTGTSTDLARVHDAYLPLLPVPPVGVHKEIAERLGLDAANVYQAIRRIRAEMRLPQYNPPELHAAETVAATTATKAESAHATREEIVG